MHCACASEGSPACKSANHPCCLALCGSQRRRGPTSSATVASQPLLQQPACWLRPEAPSQLLSFHTETGASTSTAGAPCHISRGVHRRCQPRQTPMPAATGALPPLAPAWPRCSDGRGERPACQHCHRSVLWPDRCSRVWPALEFGLRLQRPSRLPQPLHLPPWPSGAPCSPAPPLITAQRPLQAAASSSADDFLQPPGPPCTVQRPGDGQESHIVAARGPLEQAPPLSRRSAAQLPPAQLRCPARWPWRSALIEFLLPPSHMDHRPPWRVPLGSRC